MTLHSFVLMTLKLYNCVYEHERRTSHDIPTQRLQRQDKLLLINTVKYL